MHDLLRLTAAAIVLCACGEPSVSSPTAAPTVQQPPPAPAPAMVADDDRPYVGVVLADATVDVAPSSSGVIERLSVHVGQSVEQGEVLAVLSGARQQAELAAARTAVATARASVRRAKVGVEHHRMVAARTRRLAKAGHETAAAADQAGYEFKQAQADLDHAEASLATAQAERDRLALAVDDLEVLAPFSGHVALRYLDRGAWASPGAPIVRLVSGVSPRVRFAVPPHQVGPCVEASTLSVAIGDPPVELEASTISAAPDVDAASGLVVVEATIVVPQGASPTLRAGEPAWVTPPPSTSRSD